MNTHKKKPAKKATKKKATTKKPTAVKLKKVHAESDLSSGWKFAGNLKRTDIKSAKDPVGKLHKKLLEFAPTAVSISQFGMGQAAIDLFREQVVALVKKEYPWISDRKLQSTVGFTLLQAEPCSIEGVEGFEVYVRSENWRDDK